MCLSFCSEKSPESTRSTTEPVVQPEKETTAKPAEGKTKATPKGGWIQFKHEEQMFTASAPAGSETTKVMRKHLVDRKHLAFVYKISNTTLGSVHHFTLTETAEADPKTEMLRSLLVFAGNMSKKMPKVEDATFQGFEARKFRSTYTQDGQNILLQGYAVIQDPRRFAIVFSLSTIEAEAEGARFVRSVVFQ